MVSLAPRAVAEDSRRSRSRRAGEPCRRHHRQHGGRGQSERRVATAAAAKPPSTSAPSPPITTMPRRAGIATHERREDQRRGARQVFCSENGVPKPPRQSSEIEIDRRLAEDEQEDREEHRRGEQRDERDGAVPPRARCARGARRVVHQAHGPLGSVWPTGSVRRRKGWPEGERARRPPAHVR